MLDDSNTAEGEEPPFNAHANSVWELARVIWAICYQSLPKKASQAQRVDTLTPRIMGRQICRQQARQN